MYIPGAPEKRPGFWLIYFTIRFVLTGHFHCFIMNLSYIFCVLKNFLFMTIFKPWNLDTLFGHFCTCKEMDFIIILNFRYKTICALNSMFLSASFSFNVILHKPYFEKMQKIPLFGEDFTIRGMSSRINKSFPKSSHLLACTTVNSLISEKYITASRKCTELIAVFYSTHVFQAHEDSKTSLAYL